MDKLKTLFISEFGLKRLKDKGKAVVHSKSLKGHKVGAFLKLETEMI